MVLPQPKWKIAHNYLVQHLKKHRYIQTKYINELFVHELQDISFTLVVDDFGIKYTHKDGMNRLISVKRGEYKFYVEFNAQQ